MSIDLSKLTPAPWECVAGKDGYFNLCYGPRVIAQFVHRDECESAALARNALDIMLRRGWGVEAWRNGWRIEGSGYCATVLAGKGTYGEAFVAWHRDNVWPDPFTAIVESDRWLSEKEKANA